MVVGVNYSKKQINRAGKLLRDFRTALVTNDITAAAKFDAHDVGAAITIVEHWRSLHARPLGRVNAGLRYYIRKVGTEPEVTQRLKRLNTVVHKLGRQRTMALTNMEDIGGVRVILPTQRQVLEVVDMLGKQDRWTIKRRRFYIEGGEDGIKKDGYRAVHLIVVKDDRFVEIQLRTPWQDVWAQSVEQDTRRLRQDLKFGSGPDDLRDYYRTISEYFAMREAHVLPSEDFMDALAKQYAATRRYFKPPEEEGPTA